MGMMMAVVINDPPCRTNNDMKCKVYQYNVVLLSLSMMKQSKGSVQKKKTVDIMNLALKEGGCQT